MPVELPSATLILVRHGDSRAADGSYDRHTPLSELGVQQAEALVHPLAELEPPVAIYTSPWPRAVDTAVPLCSKLGMQAQVDARLEEFEIDAEWLKASGSRPEDRPDLHIWEPGHRARDRGETLAEFSVRVAGACEELVRRHLEERVVVFTHSGTIDAALRWAMGISPDHHWQSDMPITTASITELAYWPGGRIAGGAPRYAALRRIGDISHLGELASAD